MRFCEELKKERAESLNGVVLAFVGDAVYSLFVREKLVAEGDRKTGDLNRRSSAVVCAKAQAVAAKEIYPLLTEEEQGVFRRGRNAKKPSHAKNAGVAEYNLSTALEAVFGYLYLTGGRERLNELLSLAADISYPQAKESSSGRARREENEPTEKKIGETEDTDGKDETKTV